MATEQGHITNDPRLARERWTLLLDQARIALITNLGLAVMVFTALSWQTSTAPLVLWLALQCAANLSRLYMVHRLPNHRDHAWSSKQQQQYIAATICSGLLWGILPAIGTANTEVLRVFLYSTVLVIAAGSHVTLGGHRQTYTLFVISMLVPLALYFFWRGLSSPQFFASSMMMVLYGLFLISSGRRYSQSLSRTFRLSFQNADMAKEMATAQQALQESESRLRRTFDAIGDIVITTDDAFNINFVNPAGLEFLGLTQDSVLGQSIADVLKLYDDERLRPIEKSLLSALNTNHRKAINWRCRIKTEAKDYLADVELTAAPFLDIDQQLQGCIITLHDTSEIHQLRRHMSWQAKHDPLTALYNRREFESRLAGAWFDVLEKEQAHVLCYIDLDNFKAVNDGSGHTAGDNVLTQIAQLMQAKIRNTDTLARLGGDEFGLILHNCNLDAAAELMSSFHYAVSMQSFCVDDQQYEIGMSIGMTALSDDYHDLEAAIRAADRACYQAKQTGRNQLCIAPEPVNAENAEQFSRA